MISASNMLQTIYNSLILSHIIYSILVWGFKSSQISKLQKRAVHMLLPCSKYNADGCDPGTQFIDTDMYPSSVKKGWQVLVRKRHPLHRWNMSWIKCKNFKSCMKIQWFQSTLMWQILCCQRHQSTCHDKGDLMIVHYNKTHLFYHCLAFNTISMESDFGFKLCTLFLNSCTFILSLCAFYYSVYWIWIQSNSVHVLWTSCYNFLSTDKDVTPTSAVLCQSTREFIVAEVILSLQMSHDTPSSCCVVEKGDGCMWRFVPAECWVIVM